MISFRAPRFVSGLTSLLLGSAVLPLGHAQEAALTIGLIADRPQSELEAQWLSESLRAIAPSADLLLHAGGIRHEEEPCQDDLYLSRYERLQSSPVPLLYTPAALDWALCDSVAGQPYPKAERLTFLRQTFFSSSRSLGQNALPLTRQSQSKRFPLYVENQRMQWGDTVLLTLHLPENNNNYSHAAGRNGEFEERDLANRDWLESGFRFAHRQQAKWLLILASADLDFDQILATPRSPYHALLSTLAEQLAQHAFKVLWISRGQSPQAPLLDQPRPETHFWRVRSHDSQDPGVWTRIQLSPKGPDVSAQYAPLR